MKPEKTELVVSGHPALWDHSGKLLPPKWEDEEMVLLTIVSTPTNKEETTSYWDKDKKFRWTPVLMLRDGRICRTTPYYSEFAVPVNRNSVLSSLGLKPHIDVDLFILKCFEVGYTSISIGPSAYTSGSFGIECKYEKENEPRNRSWPAIWELSKEFDLHGGSGGHHTSQLIRFIPTGKYGFGTHKKG